MKEFVQDIDKQISALVLKRDAVMSKARHESEKLAKEVFLSAKWDLIYDGGVLKLYVKDKKLANLLKRVCGNCSDSEIVLSSGAFGEIEPFNKLLDCWLDHNFDPNTGKRTENSGIECEIDPKQRGLAEFIEMLIGTLPNMKADQSAFQYIERERKELFRIEKAFLSRIKS